MEINFGREMKKEFGVHGVAGKRMTAALFRFVSFLLLLGQVKRRATVALSLGRV